MPSINVPTVQSIQIYPIKSCHYIQIEECEVDNLGIKNDRRFMIVYEDTNRFVTQRKFASLSLLRTILNEKENKLTLLADGQEPFILPLKQDLELLTKRTVTLWKDTLTVYDLGDEVGEWITQFLINHRQHDRENNHSVDDPIHENDPVSKVRLVTLDDPAKGVYDRPAHPYLKGVHTAFSDWSPISFGFVSSLEEVNKGLLETGISKGNQIPMNRFRNNITIAGTIPWEEDQWLVAKVGEVTAYIVQPIARCTVPSINQDTGIKDAWDGKGPTDYLKIRRQFADEPNMGQFCCDVIPLTAGKIRVGDKIEILEHIPEKYKQSPLPFKAAA
ncbi:MOSC N-terminal beta barrel domain-containing protein [Cokeromyces recurvatus]|uniref:MOSC N-terminal beta barrel domain-containing protein n=1 Tax=Cokeromyces recurvatus TaxID=90255 RepID=UPI00221E7B43|nr:MOSC N-terminal beta barrel domain-containing protein [Cokeromyces recurvatus]KAI7902154.1 MOSC N-terminal beta barrel domain-containing protein [Cokeromyces recurvatus]